MIPRTSPTANRYSRLGACAALFLLLGSGQVWAERWYRVELLAFGQRGAEQLEQWPATPALDYPAEGRFLAAGDDLVGATSDTTDSDILLDEGEELRPNLPAFHTLPASRRDFNDVANQMARSGRYRVLFHETWAQPVASKRQAVPIILDRSGDTGQWPELQGSITLHLSRYLHLETNLWVNTTGDYLPGDWQMPAPPLGPRSGLDENDALVAVTDAPDDDANVDLPVPEAEMADAHTLGPAYPYRHAVALQQKRRMRSKEIHYIDHPMLGLIIKFTPLRSPEPEIAAATTPR